MNLELFISALAAVSSVRPEFFMQQIYSPSTNVSLVRSEAT